MQTKLNVQFDYITLKVGKTNITWGRYGLKVSSRDPEATNAILRAIAEVCYPKVNFDMLPWIKMCEAAAGKAETLAGFAQDVGRLVPPVRAAEVA